MYKGEIKYCDRFIKEVRVTQCVRYQEFSHIVRFYKNTTRYGRYLGDYTTREYLKLETARKYVLYKGNYVVWLDTYYYRI